MSNNDGGPDRINARPMGTAKDWANSDSGPWSMDNPYGTSQAYLLSTPAREHAEELVEVMGKWMELTNRLISERALSFEANTLVDIVQGRRETSALLSKIQGDSNE